MIEGLGNAWSDWLLPSKMISYPAVTATITTATNVYTATKNYNRITEMTAEFAEKTAGAIAATATPLLNASLNASQPLLTKMEPTLRAADKYAAEKLEQMEEKAPLMNEEPGKIYQMAKETTVQTVQTTVSTINNSCVGQCVSSTLQPLIGMAESASGEDGTSSGQGFGQSEVSLEQTVRRVYTVGTKLQRVALDKAYENVTSLKTRSQETLVSLTMAVDLIQYANTFEKTTRGTKMRRVIEELLEDDFEDSGAKYGQDSTGYDSMGSQSSDVDRKALVVTRNLTKKLGGAYEGLVTYAEPYFGAKISSKLQQGQPLIDSIHNTFLNAKSMKDVSNTCIEGAKSNIQSLSKILEDLSKDLYTYVKGSSVSRDGIVDSPIPFPRERDDSESSYSPSESLEEPNDSQVMGHVNLDNDDR